MTTTVLKSSRKIIPVIDSESANNDVSYRENHDIFVDSEHPTALEQKWNRLDVDVPF